jgi:hypothetical protein
VFEHRVDRDELVAAADVSPRATARATSVTLQARPRGKGDVVMSGVARGRYGSPSRSISWGQEGAARHERVLHVLDPSSPTPSSVEAIAQLRERLSDQRTPVIPPRYQTEEI